MGENPEDDYKTRIADPVFGAIGHFGRWQLMICSLLFLVRLPVSSHQFALTFLAPPVNFECVEPIQTDKCSRECVQIRYDRSTFQETIITSFDLICDYKYAAKLSQSLFVLGSLIGNGIFGICSDKFGRKPALQIAILVLLVCGVGAAISPWFWLFCVMRFLIGFGLAGSMLVGLVIIVEIVGPEKRATMTILQNIPVNMGYVSLAVVSYFLRHWRSFQFAISVPSVIFMSYYWLIPESPRWLLSHSQYDKASRILEKAAKFNNMPTEHIRSDIIASRKRSSLTSKLEIFKPTIFDLFRYTNLRVKTIYMCVNSFASGASYAGIVLYIAGISGNIFYNVAISGMFGLPGTLIAIPLAKYLGRKKTLITTNALVGIIFLFIAFVPHMPDLVLIELTFGFFCLAIIMPISSLYCAELLPTVLRNSGLGLAGTIQKIGAMLAPVITYSSVIMEWFPPIIFAVTLLTTSILGFLLPEGTSDILPETIEDSEKLTVNLFCCKSRL